MTKWKAGIFEDGVDAKIATHTAIAAAHHVKYTDAEAVSAVATADDYVKNDGDEMTATLIMTNASIIHFKTTGWIGEKYSKADATEIASFEMDTNSASPILSYWSKKSGSWVEIFGMEMSTPYDIDFNSHRIKDPKNHVHSALSGTKKLVEINIGGTSYYFEVYPTKA